MIKLKNDEVINSCFHCKALIYIPEDDSYGYYHECSERPQNANLKSFPFLKTKCNKFISDERIK
jgi:hypothetical protein